MMCISRCGAESSLLNLKSNVEIILQKLLYTSGNIMKGGNNEWKLEFVGYITKIAKGSQNFGT